MKQKDVAIIIIIAFFSGMLSLVVANYTFGSQKNRQQTAEVVDVIDSTFPAADKRYFNDASVDPTWSITIGDNNNQDPFGGSGNSAQ